MKIRIELSTYVACRLCFIRFFLSENGEDDVGTLRD